MTVVNTDRPKACMPVGEMTEAFNIVMARGCEMLRSIDKGVGDWAETRPVFLTALSITESLAEYWEDLCPGTPEMKAMWMDKWHEVFRIIKDNDKKSKAT
jgi:hypothetical protein